MSARTMFLPAAALARLKLACIPIRESLGQPYLVGTCLTRPEWRDVDVRVILPDHEWDALFGDRRALWSLLCLTVSDYLTRATDLPIDFQVQRMTEANDQHHGPRSALLRSDLAALYAAGGDATRFAGVDRD